ncbi:hypothetical protein BV20DRAFT_1078435, partial [Pilatotrama ljubarskyi]
PTTAVSLNPSDSEDEVDATLSQDSESSSSGSSSPIDCSGRQLIFDVEEGFDRHWDGEEWTACYNDVCPNRYTQVPHPVALPNWALPVEATVPLSEQSPEAFTPVPLPPTLPTLPFDLDFSLTDFQDSPQFYLLAMGDIKPKSMPVLSSASQYNSWAAKMKGYLMFMNCWDVVDGTKRRPADAHAEAQKEWDKMNAQALSCSVRSCRGGDGERGLSTQGRYVVVMW